MKFRDLKQYLEDNYGDEWIDEDETPYEVHPHFLIRTVSNEIDLWKTISMIIVTAHTFASGHTKYWIDTHFEDGSIYMNSSQHYSSLEELDEHDMLIKVFRQEGS